jgi:hypothetical protein
MSISTGKGFHLTLEMTLWLLKPKKNYILTHLIFVEGSLISLNYGYFGYYLAKSPKKCSKWPLRFSSKWNPWLVNIGYVKTRDRQRRVMLPKWVFCHKNGELYNCEGEFCKWSSTTKSDIIKIVPMKVEGNVYFNHFQLPAPNTT